MSEENNKKANKQEKQPKPDAAAPAAVADENAPKAAPVAETAQSLLEDNLTELKVRRAKGSKNITHGVCHVLATFNNTKICMTDLGGNVISWSSSGRCNFKGSRKSTAYAAQVVTQEVARAAMAHGLKDVEVRLKGPGMGRDAAVRTLQALGLNVLSILDVTPVPHNGCRPRKQRRV